MAVDTPDSAPPQKVETIEEKSATAAVSHHPLNSTYPVYLPYQPELFYDALNFLAYISSTEFVPNTTNILHLDITSKSSQRSPSIYSDKTLIDEEANSYLTTLNPLVELWNVLPRLLLNHDLNVADELQHAWNEDPLITLKIIWNLRSIYVGQGDKILWYRCMGWMAKTHPKTFLANLPWVVRPVIETKKSEAAKDRGIVKAEHDDAFGVTLHDAAPGKGAVTRRDVDQGASHGYYQDLSNLLILATKGKLNTTAVKEDLDGRSNLADLGKKPRKRKLSRRQKEKMTPAKKARLEEEYAEQLKAFRERQQEMIKNNKAMKHEREKSSQEWVIHLLDSDPIYKALHITIARIFAEQLAEDKKHLNSSDPGEVNKISLAAKWAPSLEKNVDRTTLLATTISELLFTPTAIGIPSEPREIYLKHARQHYRMLLSQLRKKLDIVEIKITEKRFSEIDYSHLPRGAMHRYKNVFLKRDPTNIASHQQSIALSKLRLTEEQLMSPPKIIAETHRLYLQWKTVNPNSIHKAALELELKSLERAWVKLVHHLRSTNVFSSAVAVVDVSSSMRSPAMHDGLTPLYTSIALGLLVAHLTNHPFENQFITFSARPHTFTVPSCDHWELLPEPFPLAETVNCMERADWHQGIYADMVFKDVLLPTAIHRRIQQEDMVKKVFIFTDMSFERAVDGNFLLRTYDEVKEAYRRAKYTVPEIVLWNLAGGLKQSAPASPTVTKLQPGITEVSGYTNGMLGVFLKGGEFDNVMEEDIMVEQTELAGHKRKFEELGIPEGKMEPLATLMRAVGHPSYDMLAVAD